MKKILKLRALAVFLLLGCILVPTLFPQIAVAAGKKSSRTLKKGDSVWFGNYEQNDIDDGPEPLEWIVVEDKGDTLLLMSKYILANEYYSYKYDDYSWKNSKVRDYCNKVFYHDAFSNEERKAIKKSKVTDYYGNTKDKVYVFSEDEVNKYFSFDKDKKCLQAYVTVVAAEGGTYCETYAGIRIMPEDKKYRGMGQWVLRGPYFYNGEFSGGPLCITMAAMVGGSKYPTENRDGIRPVINVRKDAVLYKDPSESMNKDPKKYIYKNVEKKPQKVTKKAKKPTKLKLSGKKNDIITTKNYSYIETNKYCIFFDKNVSVRGNLIKDINKIIKTCEEQTGFKLTPNNDYWVQHMYNDDARPTRYCYFDSDMWEGINSDNKKISIYVLGENQKDCISCCTGNEIIYTSEDFNLYDERTGARNFIHELLHCLQLVNSSGLSEKLSEGYAAYNEIRISKVLNDFPNEGYFFEEEYYKINDEEIVTNNPEREFIQNYTEIFGEHNQETYEFGFALVKYMTEEYPNISFNKLLEEISDFVKENDMFNSNESIEKEIIKKIYGDDFFIKFSTWLREKYK